MPRSTGLRPTAGFASAITSLGAKAWLLDGVGGSLDLAYLAVGLGLVMGALALVFLARQRHCRICRGPTLRGQDVCEGCDARGPLGEGGGAAPPPVT